MEERGRWLLDKRNASDGRACEEVGTGRGGSRGGDGGGGEEEEGVWGSM